MRHGTQWFSRGNCATNFKAQAAYFSRPNSASSSRSSFSSRACASCSNLSIFGLGGGRSCAVGAFFGVEFVGGVSCTSGSCQRLIGLPHTVETVARACLSLLCHSEGFCDTLHFQLLPLRESMRVLLALQLGLLLFQSHGSILLMEFSSFVLNFALDFCTGVPAATLGYCAQEGLLWQTSRSAYMPRQKVAEEVCLRCAMCVSGGHTLFLPGPPPSLLARAQLPVFAHAQGFAHLAS